MKLDKTDLLAVGKKIIFTANKYKPKALIGVSAGLTAGAIILAIKAGMEYQKLKSEGKTLTWQDYARIFGPCIAAGSFAMACAFAGLTEEEKRTAAFAGLVSMYEQNQKDFDAKAREMFGNNKTEKLYDEVAKEQMRRAPEPMTAYGGNAFFDCMTGQWIYMDIESIRARINNINERITSGRDVTQAEWCDVFNEYSVAAQEELGWSRSLTGIIEYDFVFMEDLHGHTVSALQLKPGSEPKIFYTSEDERNAYMYNPGWSEV